MEIINREIAQQIVDTVKDVSGKNINFINEKGIIIASTDESRIDMFHESGYQVVSSGIMQEVSDDSRLLGTQRGVNVPIIYNGNVIAAVGISGEAEEVRRFASLAQKITLIILKERELETIGIQKKSRMNYIIRSLINHEVVNPVYMQGFLTENNLSGATQCRIVLVCTDFGHNQGNIFMLENIITQTFAQIKSGLYTYNYPNEYVLLMEERYLTKTMPMFQNLEDLYGTMLSVGVGSLESVDRIHQSYQTAKIAVHAARRLKKAVIYEELGYELLLGNLNSEFRSYYINKILSKLDKEDIHILRTYFYQDMSLQRTSEALYMHKNTLQYKLNRISNISGYNPRVFRDAVVLHSAVELMKMEKGTGEIEGS